MFKRFKEWSKTKPVFPATNPTKYLTNEEYKVFLTKSLLEKKKYVFDILKLEFNSEWLSDSIEEKTLLLFMTNEENQLIYENKRKYLKHVDKVHSIPVDFEGKPYLWSELYKEKKEAIKSYLYVKTISYLTNVRDVSKLYKHCVIDTKHLGDIDFSSSEITTYTIEPNPHCGNPPKKEDDLTKTLQIEVKTIKVNNQQIMCFSQNSYMAKVVIYSKAPFFNT